MNNQRKNNQWLKILNNLRSETESEFVLHGGVDLDLGRIRNLILSDRLLF